MLKKKILTVITTMLILTASSTQVFAATLKLKSKKVNNSNSYAENKKMVEQIENGSDTLFSINK